MTYEERRLETIRLQKKFQNQNLKEQVLFAFIASFIIVLSIYALNLQLGQAVDKCSVNHDRNYCVEVLK